MDSTPLLMRKGNVDAKPKTPEEIERFRLYMASDDSADIVRRDRDGDEESGWQWLATVDELRAALAQRDAEVARLRAAMSNLISGLMMDYPLVAIGMNGWPPIVAARAALAEAPRHE